MPSKTHEETDVLLLCSMKVSANAHDNRGLGVVGK